MGEVANCPRCNAIFMKGVKSVCNDCYKKEEEAFDKVYNFIRKKKNRTASINEVVAATDVEKDLVLKFVKEQRLRKGMFPNLMYPCQKCGKDINEGKLCGNCSDTIRNDLKREIEIEDLQKSNDREASATYYAVGKNKPKP